MLRIAEADGIEIIAATPHAHHAHAERIRDGVERLRQVAAEAGLTIEIVPGHEARLAPDLADRYGRQDLIPINHTSYQLVELHLFEEWPRDMVERSIGRIQGAGLTPLLAHPERYPVVQRDPSWLEALIERGILMQVNSHSLTGYHGADAKATAEVIIRHGLAHVIASDAHNPARRPPAISAALQRAAELAGDDYAARLIANAAAIVRGEDVQVNVPAMAEERS